jgi:hypothetical protein
MRQVLPLALLIVAACTGAAEDTTTTAPLAEPSTTATTAPSTTTTTDVTTTTTTVDECTERDGVLRNSRGFVCPPHLRAYELVPGSTDTPTGIHLPGTYTLRQFTPAISFTRDERFTSPGENSVYVEYDIVSDQSHMVSYTAHQAFARFPDQQPSNHDSDWVWKNDLEVVETTVGGFPTTITTFSADCLSSALGPGNDGSCLFTIEDEDWLVFDGQRSGVIVVDLPDGAFTILVESRTASQFDRYWAETVQPFLDSIEFLDQ